MNRSKTKAAIFQWPKEKPNGNDDVPCTEGIVFADPMLGDLADNGGPTPTIALAETSPALSAGADCPDRDQRGEPRDTDICDVGAFEL